VNLPILGEFDVAPQLSHLNADMMPRDAAPSSVGVGMPAARTPGFRPANPDPTTWRRFVSQLPPGRNEPLSVEWNVGDWTARPGVEIAFQDAAGRSWVREWNGKLSEVEKTDPLKRLGLEEPLGWDSEGPA
jgi:hypothetical protein